MDSETPSHSRHRPSPAQTDKLLDFLEQHPWLATSVRRYKTLHQKEQNRKAWQKIAVQLNKMDGCTKNYQRWAKHWTDKRNIVKKKLALLNREKNSSNQDMPSGLSDVEKRTIDIMNMVDCAFKNAEGNDLLEESDKSLQEETIPTVKEESSHNNSTEHNQSYLTVMKQDPPVEVATPGPASPAASSDSDTQEPPARPLQNTAPSSRYRRRIASSRRLSYAHLTERFLKLKEQRLEVHRRNSRLLETLLKHESERDKVITQVLQTTTEGIRILTEAIRNKSFV
ncbi:hypothetical protein ABMA28_012790 [Loxostege sticticalis]|uniref:Regulatory protein zeste n=1 Tax=Loxostege sticticalis TaxID=481309 RepID=A0ABD0S2Q7_LOXSC